MTSQFHTLIAIYKINLFLQQLFDSVSLLPSYSSVNIYKFNLKWIFNKNNSLQMYIMT